MQMPILFAYIFCNRNHLELVYCGIYGSNFLSLPKKHLNNLVVQGTGCEMYTETLSPSFNGMSFVQAAETCFVRVRISNNIGTGL